MDKIDRIIVTGDIFRLNAGGAESQNVNIRWLYHVVRPALAMVCGLPVEPLLHLPGSPFVSEIYRANNLPLGLESWVSIYGRHPGPRELALIYQQFAGSLVVSFEMPEFMRHALDKLDIPYVDFTVHPVRFLDDLAFGLRTNRTGVSEVLQPWVLRESEMHIMAGLALSSLSRLPAIAECAGKAGVGLFAGQTADDKVLIRDGKLIELGSVMPFLADIAARHETVIVKAHPYARDNAVIMAMTRLFPNAVTVDANFYHLLAQDAISDVYSITSSTSIEAAYFGKRGHHIARYPYAFSETVAMGGAFLQIKPGFFQPTFWASLLQAMKLPVGDFDGPVPALERNRMRRALRSFWGADILEYAG